MDEPLTQALRHALDRWMKCAPCLGCNVALLDERHGTFLGASGDRDLDSDGPMPLDASFYIYSITKMFVAAALLRLDVELDRPISAHLTGLAMPDKVTVRRLLNHTAGVPSYTDLPDYALATCQSPGQPWSREEVIRRCLGREPDFPPGDGWHYSNTGYLLLTMLIETLTGKILREAITDGVLTPLGLDRTYIAETTDTGLITPGFTRELNHDERMIDVMPIYHPGWCLTGVMVSTVSDVARFFSVLMAGGLLTSRQLAEMTAPVPIQRDAGQFFQSPSYGLGLMMDPDWGHGGLFGHGGDGPGANTWAMHLPDFHGRAVTLVAFCNTTMGGHPFYLVKDLLRILAEA